MALVLNLKTDLVIPQFHVVFGDEFTTVPYLSSSETPPNWNKLLEHSIEHATEEQHEISDKWLHPQTNQQDHESDNVPNSREALSQQEINSTINVSEKEKISQISEITEENKNGNNTFINLDTMGLRHSGRVIDPSRLLKESDPNLWEDTEKDTEC